MKKRKIALIGCGYWGVKYLNILNARFPETILYCAEKKSNIKDRLSSKFSNIKFYSEGEDLLDSVELDGVIIATEPEYHHLLSLKAVKMGIPVLLEKPLFLSSKGLKDLFPFRNKIYQGYTFLQDDAIKTIKDYIIKKGLNIHSIHFKWHAPGIKREYINSLWDVGPHPLSILFYLSENDFNMVDHHIDTYNSSLYLKSDKGMDVIIDISCNSTEKIRLVNIGLSDGSNLVYDHEKEHRLYVIENNDYYPLDYTKTDNLTHQIDEFINSFIYKNDGDIVITSKIIKLLDGIDYR